MGQKSDRERELKEREQELERREARLRELERTQARRDRGGVWDRVTISKRTLDRVILALFLLLAVVLIAGMVRAM